MKSQTQNLVVSALFLTLGVLFPIILHSFGWPIGQMLLPMHIPVLLCGFLCGWKYGGVCGLLTPLLSTYITARPPLYPVALAMMFELCAYGVLSGLFYKKIRLFKRNLNVFFSLIVAMIGGRMVFGIANAFLLGLKGSGYAFRDFINASIYSAWPGIVIQLVLIPTIVIVLTNAKIFRQQ